jgi:hypothetical protein
MSLKIRLLDSLTLIGTPLALGLVAVKLNDGEFLHRLV